MDNLILRGAAPGMLDRASAPNPSALRISLPEPSVKSGVRGVLGMCTVLIVLISMFLLAG